MTHDDKEQEQIATEHDHLKNAWFRFFDEIINGSTLERHAPPALMAACARIIEMQVGTEIAPDTNPLLGIPFLSMSDFGAAMFIFGQFCMKDGIVAANMVPCGCDIIDDDELKRFISR